MLPFYAGPNGHGYPSLMICPMNAAFFALSLANMQGFVSIADVPEHYKPRAIIYVAPPFRHTHFDGKQVVVHNRSAELTRSGPITSIRAERQEGRVFAAARHRRARGLGLLPYERRDGRDAV